MGRKETSRCGRVVFSKGEHNNASALSRKSLKKADSPSGDQEFESPHLRHSFKIVPF
jgi:hypothetical protein